MVDGGRRLSAPPIVVTPRLPVLSRAGTAAILASFCWFFVSGITMAWLMNEAHLVGDERPVLEATLIAYGPLVVLISGWLIGHRRGFRWMLRWPQPEVRLDDEGLDLVLPDVGRHRWRWHEVGGLEPAPHPSFWRRVWGWGGVPNARLVDPSLRPLANVPRELIGAGTHRTPKLAETAVSMRPDRFGFRDAGTLLHGPWFFTSLDQSLPRAAVERSARKRWIFHVGRVTVGVALVVVIVVWELARFPA
jgi:hypothetical protein